MGWFKTSEERRKEELQEAHNEGQRDGADGIAPWTAGAKAAFMLDGEKADAYLAGTNNGAKNQPKD